jgi:hypothetical protein
MPMTPETMLLGIAAFLVKHFIADYMMQTKFMLYNKGNYGHPGGIYHAGVHMLTSIPVLLALGAGGLLTLLLIIFEGIFHYHVDWGKEKAQSMLGLTIDKVEYWYLFGLDQVLHQLTYVVMLWIVLTY